MSTEKCESCAYYDKANQSFGCCHRFPPTKLELEQDNNLPRILRADDIDEPRWPFVVHDDWCGEFRSHKNALQNLSPTTTKGCTMKKEKTWHKVESRQTEFDWNACDDGIQISHSDDFVSYLIPWDICFKVLHYAKNLATEGSGLATAGMSMTNPTPGSVGGWVQKQKFKIKPGQLTPRHLSFLGPIFGSMNIIERETEGLSIKWKFDW